VHWTEFPQCDSRGLSRVWCQITDAAVFTVLYELLYIRDVIATKGLCVWLQAYPEFLITYQIVKPDSCSIEQLKS